MPEGSGDPEPVSRAITASFRRLSDAERSELQPLRIRVTKALEGENLTDVAARSALGRTATGLIALLNGAEPDTDLAPGQRLKIISE